MKKFTQDLIEFSEKSLKTLEKNKKHKFSSGVLAATYAAAKNNDIGVLTARGSRNNHRHMTNIFGKVTGKKVKEEHNYFVNDSELSTRLSFCGRDTAMKKLHILVEYATGFRLNEDGTISNRKKYSSVKFYDDEEKNLKILEPSYFENYLKILENFLKKQEKMEEKDIKLLIARIKMNKKNIDVYNIFDFDISKLEGTTNLKIFIKRLKDKMKGGKIHFFDLDGTVFTHSVKMFIEKDGKSLFAITQEEFATDKENFSSASRILSKEEMEERKDYNVSELIVKAKNGVDGYSVNFKYFRDEDVIKEQAKIKNLKAKEDE